MKKLALIIFEFLSFMTTYALSENKVVPDYKYNNVAATSEETFETAGDFIKNMKVGWNLGNTLEAYAKTSADYSSTNYWGQQDLSSESCWGQYPTKPQVLTMMKEAGFGAIRVPVTWFNHTDIYGNIDKAWMSRVHEVVDYVIDAGMYCIINVHHDTGADNDNGKSWLKADTNNYTDNKARYEKIWKQIAEEFKDYGQQLLFESYNEMLDIESSWNYASYNCNGKYNASIATSAYDAINHYAQSFVNTVRASGGNNGQRNLIVNTYGACAGYGNWNTHLSDPLIYMQKPEGETNHLLFEVHIYPDISDLAKAKNGVDNMFKNLNEKLVSKGAPVIIGEWGTHNVDGGEGKTDYDIRRSEMLEFANYFVTQAKNNNIGTLYWMGITEGMYRQYPAFTQPDLALRILQGWYGDAYNPTLPCIDDFRNATITTTVNYTKLWGELSVMKGSISAADYSGIMVELDQSSIPGKVQIKVYCDKENYMECNQAKTTLNFTSAMGNITNITIQWKQSTPGSIKIKDVRLIRKDGSKEPANYSVSWGCNLTDFEVSTGIAQVTNNMVNNHAVFNLNGQCIENPTHGLYIFNGKKIIVP